MKLRSTAVFFVAAAFAASASAQDDETDSTLDSGTDTELSVSLLYGF